MYTVHPQVQKYCDVLQQKKREGLWYRKNSKLFFWNILHETRDSWTINAVTQHQNLENIFLFIFLFWHLQLDYLIAAKLPTMNFEGLNIYLHFNWGLDRHSQSSLRTHSWLMRKLWYLSDKASSEDLTHLCCKCRAIEAGLPLHTRLPRGGQKRRWNIDIKQAKERPWQRYKGVALCVAT